MLRGYAGMSRIEAFYVAHDTAETESAQYP